MSNKVSTYNSYTYYKHHISQYIYIYIFLTISTHLKNISNTLPRTHYKSPFLWKIYIYIYLYIYIKAEALTRCCHVRKKGPLQC